MPHHHHQFPPGAKMCKCSRLKWLEACLPFISMPTVLETEHPCKTPLHHSSPLASHWGVLPCRLPCNLSAFTRATQRLPAACVGGVTTSPAKTLMCFGPGPVWLSAGVHWQTEGEPGTLHQSTCVCQVCATSW